MRFDIIQSSEGVNDVVLHESRCVGSPPSKVVFRDTELRRMRRMGAPGVRILRQEGSSILCPSKLCLRAEMGPELLCWYAESRACCPVIIVSRWAGGHDVELTLGEDLESSTTYS